LFIQITFVPLSRHLSQAKNTIIMELTAIELELQNQLKTIIKTNGYWSKEVLEFNSKLDLDIAIKINDKVDKSF